MQVVVQVLLLGFIALFAGLTIEVIATSGFDILSAVALFILALIAIPVIGGLFSQPPDD
ncbi:MAG TPA: hypothetical protein VFB51_10200 [Solirubrobacterales bacterium]|nr:hypothetical protein [Solirubrobacterales bacterium]